MSQSRRQAHWLTTTQSTISTCMFHLTKSRNASFDVPILARTQLQHGKRAIPSHNGHIARAQTTTVGKNYSLGARLEVLWTGDAPSFVSIKHLVGGRPQNLTLELAYYYPTTSYPAYFAGVCAWEHVPSHGLYVLKLESCVPRLVGNDFTLNTKHKHENKSTQHTHTNMRVTVCVCVCVCSNSLLPCSRS